MSVSASSAFGTNGPFHFQPPKEFDGKKESFEEVSYRLKAYLGLTNPALKVVLEKVEVKLQVDINDKTFNDEQGRGW